jgi:hypothetical protein
MLVLCFLHVVILSNLLSLLLIHGSLQWVLWCAATYLTSRKACSRLLPAERQSSLCASVFFVLEG